MSKKVIAIIVAVMIVLNAVSVALVFIEKRDRKNETDALKAENTALQEQLDTAKADAEAGIENAKSELTGLVDSVREDAAAGLESAKSELTGMVDSVREDAAAGLESAKSELTGLMDSVREDAAAGLESAKSELTGLVDSVREDAAAGLESAKSELTGLVDAAKADAATGLESAKSELTGMVDAAKADAAAGLESAKSELTGMVDAAKADAAMGLESAKSELTGLVDSTKSELTGMVDAVRADTEAGIINAKSELTGLVDSAKADAQAGLAGVKGEMTELVGSVNTGAATELANTKTELMGLVDAARQDAQAGIENAKTELTGLVDSTKSELTGLVDSARADAQAGIENAKTELTGLVDSTKSELTGLVDSARADAQAGIESAKTELTGMVDAANAGVSQLQNMVTASLEQERAEILGRLDEVESGAATELANAKSELTGLVDSARADAQAGIESAKSELTGLVDSTKTELTGMVDATNTGVTQLQSMVQADLEREKNELTGRIDAADSQISQLEENDALQGTNTENNANRINGLRAEVDYLNALRMITEDEEGSRDEAIRLLTNAAENEVADAGLLLAEEYLAKGEEAKAMAWFEKEAEKGSARATYEAASLLLRGYTDGENTVCDPGKGTAYMQKAAEMGEGDALFIMGSWYELGTNGCERDLDAATELYGQAVQMGSSGAAAALAGLTVNGECTEEDKARALELYTVSAEKGNPYGQAGLARMLENGWGTEEDLEKAEQLYRAASENAEASEGFRLDALKAAEKLSAIRNAQSLMAEAKWEEAQAVLDGLEDSRNSVAEMKKECVWQRATALAANGCAGEAYGLYESIPGYKDADEQLKFIRDMSGSLRREDFAEGGTVFFGHYPQTGAGDDDTDIEWLVLNVDEEQNRALVISRYGLDAHIYHNYSQARWEGSELRFWLEDSFLNRAFTENELKLIPTVTVEAERNAEYCSVKGGSTESQIFILSVSEAERYFANNRERVCEPTEYAKVNGAHWRTAEEGDVCWWWLRVAGNSGVYAAEVNTLGQIDLFGHMVNQYTGVVRPAMWIDLNMVP